MEAITRSYKRWLIAALVVLVGSLFALAADITVAFIYFADHPVPIWIVAIGVLAAMGVALGFATMLGLMLVASLRSWRENRKVQIIPPTH